MPEIRTLSARQYATIIEALGLTQERAAEFLGFSGRMSRRYIANENELPLAAAKLLRLMVAVRMTPDDVDETYLNANRRK